MWANKLLVRAKDDSGGVTLVGLETVWEDLERVYDEYGLPPAVCTDAWRDGLPIYDEPEGHHIGYATSGAWSPILKKNLAIATLPVSYAKEGTPRVEHTVEYKRYKVLAKVVPAHFLHLERKRSLPSVED